MLDQQPVRRICGTPPTKPTSRMRPPQPSDDRAASNNGPPTGSADIGAFAIGQRHDALGERFSANSRWSRRRRYALATASFSAVLAAAVTSAHGLADLDGESGRRRPPRRAPAWSRLPSSGPASGSPPWLRCDVGTPASAKLMPARIRRDFGSRRDSIGRPAMTRIAITACRQRRRPFVSTRKPPRFPAV